MASKIRKRLDKTGVVCRDLVNGRSEIGSAAEAYDKRNGKELQWPLPNVHLGVSAENQEWADKRIPYLLQTPAAKRFVSLEPLLGPIDLTASPTNVFCEARTGPSDCNWEGDESELDPLPSSCEENTEYAGLCPICGSDASFGPSSSKTLLDSINQVIIGAESVGAHAGRECKIEWVRDIVRQCQAAGVKVFVKQIHLWGVNWDDRLFETPEAAKLCLGECKPKRVLVKKIDQFPEDLRIREEI